jgi:hypothetical protein
MDAQKLAERICQSLVPPVLPWWMQLVVEPYFGLQHTAYDTQERAAEPVGRTQSARGVPVDASLVSLITPCWLKLKQNNRCVLLVGVLRRKQGEKRMLPSQGEGNEIAREQAGDDEGEVKQDLQERRSSESVKRERGGRKREESGRGSPVRKELPATCLGRIRRYGCPLTLCHSTLYNFHLSVARPISAQWKIWPSATKKSMDQIFCPLVLNHTSPSTS